jgi:hypothetical protein
MRKCAVIIERHRRIPQQLSNGSENDMLRRLLLILSVVGLVGT